MTECVIVLWYNTSRGVELLRYRALIWNSDLIKRQQKKEVKWRKGHGVHSGRER
jgi:hypothetical protein